jgi:hypothetical protein
VASKIHTSLTHDIAYQGHHTFALTNIFLKGTGTKRNRGRIIHITEKLLREYAQSPIEIETILPVSQGEDVFLCCCVSDGLGLR